VEALQLHSNTQSHWSSGSTVSFPPGRVLGSGSCLGDAPTILEPGSPVSDVSYIGDPTMIPDHWLQ
jgi:hypothetical protein